MLAVSLIHKLFNQMVMGKQAFVKAYACFQTTASPRPFDYEYINIPDKKRNAPLRFFPLSSPFNTKMLIVMKYSFLVKCY